jgi:hypothetical protein
MSAVPAGRQACSHCSVIHALVDGQDGQTVLRRHAAPVGERPSPTTYIECPGVGRPGVGRVIERMQLSANARSIA